MKRSEMPRRKNGTYAPVLTEKDKPKIIRGLRSLKYIYEIAHDLNVDRGTMCDFIHANADLETAYQQAEEQRLDIDERALQKLCVAGNVKAIMFRLERKGRGRGYGQHIVQEVTKPPTILDDVPEDADIPESQPPEME